jgi:ATP/maltotriose-dependent transcriptional regulator MalT
MFGRHGDAAYWFGRALARPAEPTLDRDLAQALLILNRFGDDSTFGIPGSGDNKAELRALADRLLAYPELPGFAGALTAVTLVFLEEKDAALALLQRLVDGPDVWLAGLAHMFRASFAENEGNLEQVRTDVTAALDCFGRVGDRWGLTTVLPMRALLRQYDGDLDGALADLRAARAKAREFGSLSSSDEIFIDMRWVDLYMRRGDEEGAIAMLESVRERTRRVNSAELTMVVRALEASVWVRLGDLGRAEALIDETEAARIGIRPVAGDHGRALLGSVRAWLCLARGDGPGAEAALADAYAGAVESGDMPLLAMVAVTAAGLAQLYGRHADAAQLLGAAARLRGTHDWTDLQVRELSHRSRAELSEEGFTDAYDRGWQLDGQTARTSIDPARLRREALPAGDSASSSDHS